MPHTSSLFYLGRSRINHTLIGDSSTPSSFLSRTTPPTLSLGSWEVVPKSPSDLCLRINVLIDRFLAHRLPPLQSRPLANYLRRPSFLQSQINILLHFWRKSSRSLSSSPCLCLLMCLLCSIAAPTFFAFYLTANTARGSLQAPFPSPADSRPLDTTYLSIYVRFESRVCKSFSPSCVCRTRGAYLST